VSQIFRPFEDFSAGGANPGAPFACNGKIIGAYRFLAVRGAPVVENDGAVYEWISTAVDITEEKQEEIIKHICVEGWDYIGQWSGPNLKQFLQLIAPGKLRERRAAFVGVQVFFNLFALHVIGQFADREPDFAFSQGSLDHFGFHRARNRHVQIGRRQFQPVAFRPEQNIRQIGRVVRLLTMFCTACSPCMSWSLAMVRPRPG